MLIYVKKNVGPPSGLNTSIDTTIDLLYIYCFVYVIKQESL